MVNTMLESKKKEICAVGTTVMRTVESAITSNT